MPYARHTPETWTAIQNDYLCGFTAEEISRRYDLSESSLHARAAAEGWRRTDQPTVDVTDLETLDAEPAPDLAAIAALALARSLKFAGAGRLSEALRWVRLHRAYLQVQRDADRRDEEAATPAREAPDDRHVAELLLKAREAVARCAPAKLEKVEKVEPKNAARTPFERERLRKARDKALRRGQPGRAAELEALLQPP